MCTLRAAVTKYLLLVRCLSFVKSSHYRLGGTTVMPDWFTSYINSKPGRFGTLLSMAGILVLTPDTLVIRLSGLERWTLMAGRGILMV